MKRANITAYIFLLTISVGCSNPENPCALSKDVLDEIQRSDSLARLPKLRQRDKEWMENNYKEPSMLEANTETYRFICSSSFDTTEVHRIEKKDGQYHGITKIFSSRQDTVGITTKFDITEGEWKTIVDGLAMNDFWTYPSLDHRNGLDGSTWLLEGYKPIKDKCTRMNYHIIRRWSPTDTHFISMCKLIMDVKK